MKLRSFVALSLCLTLPGLAHATEVGPSAPPPAPATRAPTPPAPQGYPPPYAPPPSYAPPYAYPPPQGYPPPGY